MARAHQVTVGGYIRFAASQGAARAVRNELVDECGLKKADGEIEEVEIPTSKAELIPFLNNLLEEYEKTLGAIDTSGEEE